VWDGCRCYGGAWASGAAIPPDVCTCIWWWAQAITRAARVPRLVTNCSGGVPALGEHPLLRAAAWAVGASHVMQCKRGDGRDVGLAHSRS